MTAALTLLVVLTLSIIAVRTGAVALRLTGIPPDVARFQARSAFTGAGFTTSESEAIVNHPVRRRIASTLMVVGSIGLVSVMTTMIVSLVGSDQESSGVLHQLFWLGGVLIILWCVALNPKADRIMCGAIGKLLERSQGFNARLPLRVLQLPESHGVTRILVHRKSGLDGLPLRELSTEKLVILGIEREDGNYLNQPNLSEMMQLGDEIFVYSRDEEIEDLQLK